MKKPFILFLLSFSFSCSFSQLINFKDTNSIVSLLCSKTWIRYYVTDGIISADSLADNIVFRSNRTFYKSSSPRDSFNDPMFCARHIGKWSFGSVGSTCKYDTAPSCITITFDCPMGEKNIYEFSLELFDGREVRNKVYMKKCGNFKGPFIGYHYWRVDSLRTSIRISGFYCYRQK